ncbi:MAG: hypothetical protein ABII80_02230 [bacterium]
MTPISGVNSSDLTAFVNQLLVEKGMSNIDETTVSKMREELLAKLQKFLNIKLISRLPDDKLSEFQVLIAGTPDQVKVQKFISDNISNLTEVFSSLLLEFRKLYLGLA